MSFDGARMNLGRRVTLRHETWQRVSDRLSLVREIGRLVPVSALDRCTGDGVEFDADAANSLPTVALVQRQT
jgi:hypothetical protein